MSQIVETLKKKGDTSVDVYPNIITDNIPASAVTTAKIANGAVTNTKLSLLSVDTANIVDEAVTTDKIADGAVTSDKLALASIDGSYLEDASVNIEKLNTNILQYTHQIYGDVSQSQSWDNSNFILTFFNVDLDTQQTTSTLVTSYPFIIQGWYELSGTTYVAIFGKKTATGIKVEFLNASNGSTASTTISFSDWDNADYKTYTIYGYPNV